MSAVGITVLSVYVGGYLITARVIAGFLAWTDMYPGPKPAGDDWLIAGVLGFFAGFFWPLVALIPVFNLVGRLLNRAPFSLLSDTERSGRIRALEAEARERERHVANLERELDLR